MQVGFCLLVELVQAQNRNVPLVSAHAMQTGLLGQHEDLKTSLSSLSTVERHVFSLIPA